VAGIIVMYIKGLNMYWRYVKGEKMPQERWEKIPKVWRCIIGIIIGTLIAILLTDVLKLFG
jgi:hypothetical protein